MSLVSGKSKEETHACQLQRQYMGMHGQRIQSLEAVFPEHWGRGTGTWNMEHHFVKSWNEEGIPIPYVPNIDGTRPKCNWNDVPRTRNP
jgi:hypothetical protein